MEEAHAATSKTWGLGESGVAKRQLQSILGQAGYSLSCKGANSLSR